MPTRTTNRIHFTDLDPIRFEDLCVNIVSRLKPWRELNHYGRKGSDGGVDIRAVEDDQENAKVWIIQCKRYTNFQKGDAREVVNGVISERPDRLLLIVACDVTRALDNYFKEYAKSNGIFDAQIWTASNLESDLYSKFPDILFTYFGISAQPKGKSVEAKLKHKLRMQKKMKKDFVVKDWLQEYRETNDVSVKFKWSQVYIRSIDDTTYPKCDDQISTGISPWFKAHLYDFYHNGLELWLRAASGSKVIMDEKGNWEPIDDYNDPRQNNPKYRVHRAKLIGQVPFDAIVEYNLAGDEYDSLPHIFCKFQFNGEPYEKLKYKLDGKANGSAADWDLEDGKRTIFPQ